MDLREAIRDVNDFPHKGILFRDITPLLHDPVYLRDAIRQIGDKLDGLDFDLIAGPESRGFIFGVPLAYILKKGFIPIRKAGKLPYKTVSKSYDLEYGSATIEMHSDAINPGDRVVIVDDLLATGGTCNAICELIEEQGGIVAGAVFLIELELLNGRKLLDKYNIHSIVKY